MINYKKLTTALLTGTLISLSITGCNLPWQSTSSSSTSSTTTTAVASAETLASSSDSELSLDFKDEDLVSTWDAANCTTIALSQSQSVVSGNGASVAGSTISITSPGTYVVSGTLTDGNIDVNVADKGTVRIILNGVTITSAKTAPIIVEDAKKVLITIADGTTNTITDSTRSTTASEDYSAAIYSKADLVFNGNGTLNVNAGYKNGIKSSDDLKFVSGTYNVKSTEDGIIGKDLLGVKDGVFNITAGTDGMKSTYDTDTSKGNVIISGGTFTISAVNDGIQAQNILVINAGDFQIKTGGGAAAATMKTGDNMGTAGTMGRPGTTTTTTASNTSDASEKGLKATNTIYVYGGTFDLNCKDDGVHTNGSLYVAGGTLTINSGDDGMHADNILQIDSGNVDIQYCYEGIESAAITINGGTISVVSNDDGMNASTGSTTTSSSFQMGSSSSSSSNASLVINGGTVFVNAQGDGLDSNGTMTINGGNTVVCGPTANDNAAIDFDSNCTITGGTLMAFGSSGMLETPKSASNGTCIIAAFTSQAANTEFKLTDASGNVILSYTPVKTYASALVYTANISTGSAYTLSAGTVSQSITTSSSVTSSGVSSGGMGGGQQGGAAPGNAGRSAGK